RPVVSRSGYSSSSRSTGGEWRGVAVVPVVAQPAGRRADDLDVVAGLARRVEGLAHGERLPGNFPGYTLVPWSSPNRVAASSTRNVSMATRSSFPPTPSDGHDR